MLHSPVVPPFCNTTSGGKRSIVAALQNGYFYFFVPRDMEHSLMVACCLPEAQLAFRGLDWLKLGFVGCQAEVLPRRASVSLGDKEYRSRRRQTRGPAPLLSDWFLIEYHGMWAVPFRA